MNESGHSCCHHEARTRWYQNKTVVVTAVLIAACVLSFVVPILEPFRRSFLSYFRQIWWAILLGLVLGGAIEHFIPKKYVTSILATNRKRSIVNAVMLGFFMSLCSHGILALSIQLHKKGALFLFF